MPPKIKITPEEILDSAIQITRKKGIASVNARELAKSLGCSIQPIFRNFQSMDNLKMDLYKRVENIFDNHMRSGMERHAIPFLGLGLAYIDFARTEDNLFKFLFMTDDFKGRSVFEMMEDEENRQVVGMISGATGLNLENAEELFIAIWVMTHGIASMVATDNSDFSEEQTKKLLMDTFLGLKYQYKVIQEEKK